jgi:hypothetical protein
MNIFLRAAERLSKPGAWTQDASARDAHGIPVGSKSPDATCWCLLGAIVAEAKTRQHEARAILRLNEEVGYRSASQFNDYQTSVEPVLDLLRRVGNAS